MRFRCLIPLLICASGLSAQAGSDYGCTGLETSRDVPVLEGKEGVFFRIRSDLKMDHRVSEASVSAMARLSDALAQRGTLLIYLPVPTKALAMPHALPDKSALYAYDPSLAKASHQNLVQRFLDAGVLAVDATQTMQDLPKSQPAFFQADFHWTSFGARAAAQEVAATLKQTATYQTLETSRYETTELGERTAFSGLRRKLQLHCTKPLPMPRTMGIATRKQHAATLTASDLFGAADERPQMVLVGTSFSDSEINNFAGFLSEFTGLDVINRALTGGNQFGAIQDYLLSSDFQSSPPHVLLWENPVYNSLSRFGAGRMEELIWAVQGRCVPLQTQTREAGGHGAQLPNLSTDEDAAILVETPPGVARLEAQFTTLAKGTRTQVVSRSERQQSSGRFYIPLNTPWGRDAVSVQLTSRDENLSDVTLSICTKEEVS